MPVWVADLGSGDSDTELRSGGVVTT